MEHQAIHRHMSEKLKLVIKSHGMGRPVKQNYDEHSLRIQKFKVEAGWFHKRNLKFVLESVRKSIKMLGKRQNILCKGNIFGKIVA